MPFIILRQKLMLEMFYFLLDALMYIYTSGTTGYPKPVVITQQK